MEYPTNISKFSSVSNLVLGFDGSFGGSRSSLKFVGIKGDRLRDKVKVIETVYEVRANLADHQVPGDQEKAFGGMGL